MIIACRCGCRDARDDVHAIVAALAADDLDGAMRLGLVDVEPCPGCSIACRDVLIAARDARRFALAARERFRARQARLARREQERAARRATSTQATAVNPPLPPAAAAALARARARARGAKDP